MYCSSHHCNSLSQTTNRIVFSWFTNAKKWKQVSFWNLHIHGSTSTFIWMYRKEERKLIHERTAKIAQSCPSWWLRPHSWFDDRDLLSKRKLNKNHGRNTKTSSALCRAKVEREAMRERPKSIKSTNKMQTWCHRCRV